MNVLISSHRFAPSVGGVETVGRILAEEFTALGHSVRVVTQTSTPQTMDTSLAVIRRPKARDLIEHVRWADICLHNNISLQTAWPILALRKPWMVVHHTWIQRPDGSLSWRDYLKRFLLRFAHSIAISKAIAQSLPAPSDLIPDPYDDALFQVLPGSARDKDLIMVGRLVSDKGAGLLLQALHVLQPDGLKPNLTVVGDGPERARLETLCQRLHLTKQVHFAGERVGKELVQLMNQHRLLVVPSRWQEPFGLVALEGIACGCVVVGSSGGGLTEAIGSCGVTFPNNQVVGLASVLRDLLRHPEKLERYRQPAATHLQRHRRRNVAQSFVEQMQRCLDARSTRRRESSQTLPTSA